MNRKVNERKREEIGGYRKEERRSERKREEKKEEIGDEAEMKRRE